MCPLVYTIIHRNSYKCNLTRYSASQVVESFLWQCLSSAQKVTSYAQRRYNIMPITIVFNYVAMPQFISIHSFNDYISIVHYIIITQPPCIQLQFSLFHNIDIIYSFNYRLFHYSIFHI